MKLPPLLLRGLLARPIGAVGIARRRIQAGEVIKRIVTALSKPSTVHGHWSGAASTRTTHTQAVQIPGRAAAHTHTHTHAAEIFTIRQGERYTYIV